MLVCNNQKQNKNGHDIRSILFLLFSSVLSEVFAAKNHTRYDTLDELKLTYDYKYEIVAKAKSIKSHQYAKMTVRHIGSPIM